MKRVLVAGSDALLREMVAAILADMPVEVRTEQDVAVAAAECRQGCFDLVVMTDLAPFFNGSEPVAMLRPDFLHRPELLVFAWQHSEYAVLSLLECGVTQYVTFPLNVRRVRRKICDMLRCEAR